MRKFSQKIMAIGLAFALCLGVTAVIDNASVCVTDAAGGYYAPITATGGNALLGQVHDLITETHTRYTSYDDCRDLSERSDPGLDGKGVLEFYTHETVTSFSGAVGAWNREHVWCKSRSNSLWGTSGGGSDMHHIRPTESSLNSTRGSKKYGEVSGGSPAYSKKVGGATSELGGYVSGDTFEPLDNVKGDVARIVMYVYTHYNTYSNVYGTTNGSGGKFGTLNFTNIVDESSNSAAVGLLLDWSKQDPVDEIERTRNEAVYAIQGNRNPFIDHPEYAEAIWGNGTVTPDPSVTLKSISLNKSSLTLTTGQSETLTVIPDPVNATADVTWNSSNTAVATVSQNGEVTAQSVGTATITATSTKNSAIKAQAQITVEEAGATGTTTATITRGSVSASGSYGFFPWSAGGIGGIAYVYGGNGDSMQFNKSQSSYYIASSSQAAGGIRSVTVKSTEGSTDREWKLLTSTSPYGEVSGKPENGNDWGTKTVTSSGTTWEVNGNDTFFALTYEFTGEKGVAYLESIVVEYGSQEGHTHDGWTAWEDNGNGTHSRRTACTDHEPVVETAVHSFANGECTVCGAAQPVDPDVDMAKINAFHAAVEGLPSSGPLQARYTAIKKAIVAYQALSAGEKALSAEDIANLQTAIDGYNQTVNSYNSAANAANEAALNGLGGSLRGE